MGTREEILRLFHDRKGGYLSGEEISRHVGISRSAIWKQIGLLRELGYGIEAVPSRGYRLTETPDTLIPAEIQAGLTSRIIGKEVLYFDALDSTNHKAAELGEAGAPEGTVVIAESQSAGKGRLGRRWESPGGVNLYLSVLLRPPIMPHRAPQLTFLSAVAVARAVQEVGDLPARVKWPNDVLVHGRKIAGLLNEMSAEMEGVHHIVLGIGVNINMPREAFPQELRYPATSMLLESGRRTPRAVFARRLLLHLDRLYQEFLLDGPNPLIRAWEELFDLQGQAVEVDFEGRRAHGRVEGLDADGALLLRRTDGQVERVLAGDVRPAR